MTATRDTNNDLGHVACAIGTEIIAMILEQRFAQELSEYQSISCNNNSNNNNDPLDICTRNMPYVWCGLLRDLMLRLRQSGHQSGHYRK